MGSSCSASVPKSSSLPASSGESALGNVLADRGARRQRSGDLGRALRSVYDDTLREAVPDDFLNLLGKLS